MILCLKAHLYNWVYKAHENEFLERISSSFQKNLMISCVTIQIPNPGSERRIRKKSYVAMTSQEKSQNLDNKKIWRGQK